MAALRPNAKPHPKALRKASRIVQAKAKRDTRPASLKELLVRLSSAPEKPGRTVSAENLSSDSVSRPSSPAGHAAQ